MTFVLLSIFVLFATFGTSFAENRLSIGTAGLTSSYYAIGSGVAKAINKGVPEVTLSAEDTGASVENCNLIQNGEIELGISASNIACDSYMGIGSFEGRPNKDLKAITTLFPEAVHLVVLENSPIKTYEDLKGKKVSVYKPGSGTEVMARRIFKMHGMDIDKDMIAEHLDYSEANIGLKDKTLDAIFVWAGVPIPGIMEIATVRPIRIIPLAEEILEELVKESSYCSITSIPKETYRGMAEDIRTVAVPAVLICDGKLSEELVYKMTKSLYENIDVVRAMHVRAKNIQIKSALDGVSIPLHPGAERYYKEVGLLK